MAYRICLTTESKIAIRSYSKYINARGNPHNSKKWRENIELQIKMLQEFPHRFPIADEPKWQNKNLRRCNFGSHNIYYHVDDEQSVVTIITIVHSALDI